MSDDKKIIYSMMSVGKVVPPKKHVLKDISLSYFYGAKIGVLGLNGSGKSTLLKIMAGLDTDFIGEAHLSDGYTVGFLEQEPQLDPNLTVKEIVAQGAGGQTAKTIEEYITAGKLVPNEITVTLLHKTMEEIIRTTGNNNFLLDGFPRSLGNMEGWYEIFGKDTELPKMLYLECPFSVLEQRILGRAKYSGRSDDNLESMKLRFDTFKSETLPTVEFFKNKNKCSVIDTSGDRETVYAKVKDYLSEYTDKGLIDKLLSERAEILLGLKPYPKKS